MALPFFYLGNYDGAQHEIVLDEDTSRHMVQVLRMKTGDQLNLTDGKGHLLTCVLTNENKKNCSVTRISVEQRLPSPKKIIIAISLPKNLNRFEWFLEKVTEIGVSEIVPLICERTEKEKFRYDRMKGICVSAMLQSQQCWLPELQEPVSFERWVGSEFKNHQKLIAHCMEGNKKNLLSSPAAATSHTVICIGPEGDFTGTEIDLALQHDFIPVSLGDTRLRTETAGIVAATLLKLL